MNKNPKNGKTSNKQKGKEMKEMKLALLFFCTLAIVATILLLTSSVKLIANITNKQKDIYTNNTVLISLCGMHSHEIYNRDKIYIP